MRDLNVPPRKSLEISMLNNSKTNDKRISKAIEEYAHAVVGYDQVPDINELQQTSTYTKLVNSYLVNPNI